MIRWLHLSDVHEHKSDGYPRTRMYGKIIEEVNKRADKPDLVFFTGDLAFSGTKAEYEKLQAGFIAPLREALPDALFFPVPGNHDLMRKRGTKPRSWIGDEDESKLFHAASPEGAQKRADALFVRFSNYAEFEQGFAAWDKSDGHWLQSETGAAVWRGQIDNRTIAVVGLNTAWLCQDDQDWGKLTPGRGLLERALELAQQGGEPDLLFVLGHHPLEAMEIERSGDGVRLRQRLKQNHALYLHGHMHESETHAIGDRYANTLAIQAPSAFQAADSKVWRNGIMWGEADVQQGKLRLQPLKWNDDYREFKFDNDASANRNIEGDYFALNLPNVEHYGTSVDIASSYKLLYSQENISTPDQSPPPIHKYGKETLRKNPVNRVIVKSHNIVRNRFKFLVDDSRAAEQAVFSGITGVRVVGGSSRLRFITVAKDHDTPDDVFFAGLEQMRARTGGRMTPEFRYDAESDLEFDPLFSDAMVEGDGLRPKATLNDVLARIGAQNLIYPKRNSVVIAVVDSGVDGSRPEFRPADKQAGGWPEDPYDPWKDSRGHGTMCAVIAAGAGGDGGGFQGVAPLTPVMSCRAPGLVDGDLALIYDKLADIAADGVTVIASNSYGWHTATPPELPDGEKFSEALDNAIAAGVHVVFSAGNNHSKTGAGPTACTPNTIWQYKGLADVMTVGTCDLEGSMWGYSSRGPGQFPKQPGHGPKPDVVAPTPRMGLIAHGSRNIVAPNGWGTSGAAPQVAGLLAVLASTRPEAPRADLFDIIRQTAASLGHDKKCQGHGMIDCQAAVAMLTSKIW